jgi:hypothetical protein
MNFSADGASSYDYGIICVNFNSASGVEIVTGGNETELIIEKAPRNNAFHITSQEYSKPLSFVMQIIMSDESNINPENEMAIKKWLCKRGKYIDFQIEDERFYDIKFQVNISNPQIIKVGNVVGMEFTINCKYPYGLSYDIIKQYSITTLNQQINLNIENIDDYIYPDIIITANSAGTINITNSTEVANRIFTINNLTIGETITIKGNIPDISSSISTHLIWNDFNKHWLRLVDGINTLTVSNLCSIKLSYNEARSVGV